MAVIKYKLRGLKETSKALDKLTEPKFRKAALRSAGVTAMSPALSAIKAAAPVWRDLATLPNGSQPAALKNDIKMSKSVNVQPKMSKSGKLQKASQHELKVVIKTGKATEKYALVSEYGRESHSFMKYNVFGQEVLGFMATLPALDPDPWMRPTFDRMQASITKTFGTKLGEAVILQAKKQKKYLGK